jgi:prophage antirepressor-like protein
MSEHIKPSNTAARQDAIDIGDFAYAATGARVRRLTMPDGTHWFPASDVCRELGYTTTRKALIDHVPESRRESLETVTGSHSLSVPAGREWRRDLQVVDLQGLILLVNACTKRECLPFKQWVAEVIETIQRDGSYTLPVSEVSTATVGGVPVYAMPDQVVDLIVRLEERSLRLDEEFAAGQKHAAKLRKEANEAVRTSARAQERIAESQGVAAHSLLRIANALEALAKTQEAPMTAQNHEAAAQNPQRLDMTQVLSEWRERIPQGSDSWALALYLLPEMLRNGDYRMSIDYIGVRMGFTAQKTNSCLGLLRRVGCIKQTGFTQDGNPVYALNVE